MSIKKAPAYKVILVDDHVIFRDCMKLLLEKENIAQVIAEADNGKKFLTLLETHNPDVVIMDIEMPVMGGFEATRLAVEKHPDIKILILSMYGDEEHYFKLVEAGAKGFILKSSGKRELEDGIRQVAEGDSYFSNELLRKVIAGMNKSKKPVKEDTKTEFDFSDRELETLKHLCNGLSTTEIAEKLFLSAKSIEAYRSKLLKKTGTKNTVGLVLYAIQNKLTDTE